MYPSGSVKITMQLDAAGGKTQEFILHWPLFIFCFILLFYFIVLFYFIFCFPVIRLL